MGTTQSSREPSPTPEERRDTRMLNMQESMMKEQRIALEGNKLYNYYIL